MARPQAPCSVTVLGECVADAFTDPARSSSDELALRALPGGGPANTAVALARLGTPTRFLGRFSNDVFGTLFRARLRASGVDLTGSVTALEPSTLAVADSARWGFEGRSAHGRRRERGRTRAARRRRRRRRTRP